MSAPLLEVRGLRKSFGAVQAVRDVAFRIEPGELVALVGGNGAGKSTVLKILAGVLLPDSGELRIRGGAVRLASPADARRLGIECVYQDVALVPYLDVGHNLFLGREPGHPRAVLRALGFVDVGRMRREADAHLRRLGVALPQLGALAEELSGGQRQAIAVARALLWNPALLLLDEATAALGVHEAAEVLRLVRERRAAGGTTLMVTHSLDQVFDLADRVLVMHLGRLVADVPVAATTHRELADKMAGIGEGEGLAEPTPAAARPAEGG